MVVLAHRRVEVDRVNTACQQLLDRAGRLGPDRLQVEDRTLAVGDRVVCGRNAIQQLGVANGTRGTITALDPDRRTVIIRVDGKDHREVTLPGWYLDSRQSGEHNRRVDLAYATTGHRAQGLTKWRALVRLTGGEDANWLYVQLSRGKQDTRLYAVVGPEPQGPAEPDLPDRETGDGYAQLAQALSRAGDQTLAIDTESTPDLRRLSTAEVRAERDRLRGLLDQAPRDRAPGAGAGQRPPRAEADRVLGELAGEPAADAELGLRRHQQRRAGWLEANADLGPAYRQVVRELAWRQRATGLAVEQDRPGYLRDTLGPVPASTRGRRTWRQAAAAIEDYRHTYKVTGPDRALGVPPRAPAQRAAWRQANQAIERIQGRQRPTDRSPTDAVSRAHPIDRSQPDPARPPTERAAPPSRPGPERAAGWHPRRPAMATPHPSHPDPDQPRWPTCDDEQPGSASGRSAQPTSRPCSPTSTRTRTRRTTPSEPGGSSCRSRRPRRWSPSESGPASAARAPPPRPPTGAAAPPSWPPGAAACPGESPPSWRPPPPPGSSPTRPPPAWPGLAAAAVAWLLRPRSSPETSAWRQGAAGERRTARLLVGLERHGWVVLHDLAVPGSAANLDHLSPWKVAAGRYWRLRLPGRIACCGPHPPRLAMSLQAIRGSLRSGGAPAASKARAARGVRRPGSSRCPRGWHLAGAAP